MSQAKLGPLAVSFIKSAFDLTGTVNEIINDYCIVEVCTPVNYTEYHNLMRSTITNRIRNSDK